MDSTGCSSHISSYGNYRFDLFRSFYCCTIQHSHVQRVRRTRTRFIWDRTLSLLPHQRILKFQCYLGILALFFYKQQISPYLYIPGFCTFVSFIFDPLLRFHTSKEQKHTELSTCTFPFTFLHLATNFWLPSSQRRKVRRTLKLT